MKTPSRFAGDREAPDAVGVVDPYLDPGSPGVRPAVPRWG